MPVSTQQPPGRATSTIGVALIDGTPLVREGLSSLLNRTAGVRFLGSAEVANVGVRLCQRVRPDEVQPVAVAAGGDCPRSPPRRGPI